MANNKVVYGLLKKFGVDPTDMNPTQAWEAWEDLKKKGNESNKEYRQNTDYKQILEDKDNSGLPSKPVEAFGFANKERLNTKDHVQHAKDMGFKNQKEYERAACEFWNTKRGKLYYSNRRKRYYRYEEKTNLLCVSSNGVIHTFMKKTKKEFEKTIKVDKLDG